MFIVILIRCVFSARWARLSVYVESSMSGGSGTGLTGVSAADGMGELQMKFPPPCLNIPQATQ